MRFRPQAKSSHSGPLFEGQPKGEIPAVFPIYPSLSIADLQNIHVAPIRAIDLAKCSSISIVTDKQNGDVDARRQQGYQLLSRSFSALLPALRSVDAV